jgi:hypothetical protein
MSPSLKPMHRRSNAMQGNGELMMLTDNQKRQNQGRPR